MYSHSLLAYSVQPLLQEVAEHLHLHPHVHFHLDTDVHPHKHIHLSAHYRLDAWVYLDVHSQM